ncbi:MAG: glycosyl transferase, partial [Saprospiraceae bacterium]
MNKLNWPLFFAIVNVAIHLIFYNNLEYHRDELLYFSHGLHPAWGYASVPPLISWIATFMQYVFGFTLFS